MHKKLENLDNATREHQSWKKKERKAKFKNFSCALEHTSNVHLHKNLGKMDNTTREQSCFVKIKIKGKKK